MRILASARVMSRAEAREVARCLKEAGHEVVFAGGAVRDELLQREGGDIDIATSATPDEVCALFAHTLRVGAAFGVVKVIREGGQFDVATFRQDVGIGDGRHPAAVAPATLEEDVLRRDFTINGLVQDPFTGAIIDHVGGRDDLSARLIRAIGDPAQRFEEDGLRLLRGVRFAATLGFDIEEQTRTALSTCRERLRAISGERVRSELQRMLVGPWRRRAVELLDESGLLEVILPEALPMKGCEQPPEFHPEGDVWIHTLLALDGLPDDTTFELALAMLLHDIGKPPTFVRAPDRIRFDGHVELGAEMAEAICGRLRMSRSATRRVHALVRDHIIFKDVPSMRASRLRRLMAEEHFEELMLLYRADCGACHGLLTALPAIEAMQERLAEEALIPAPLLTGRDLIERGVESGPRVGALLREAADLQLEGNLEGREAALHWLDERLSSGGTPGA